MTDAGYQDLPAPVLECSNGEQRFGDLCISDDPELLDDHGVWRLLEGPIQTPRVAELAW